MQLTFWAGKLYGTWANQSVLLECNVSSSYQPYKGDIRIVALIVQMSKLSQKYANSGSSRDLKFVTTLWPRPPGTYQLQDETGLIDSWPQENSASQGTMGCLRMRCWKGLFIGLGLCEVVLGNVVTTQRQYDKDMVSLAFRLLSLSATFFPPPRNCLLQFCSSSVPLRAHRAHPDLISPTG